MDTLSQLELLFMRWNGKYSENRFGFPADNSLRGITRDPKNYPDPDNFHPERWLAPNFPTYREPLSEYPNLKGYSQFGFGRRTCQGVDIVEQELFLVMGGLAWAFDIRKKKSKFGYEVPVPADKYTSLLIAKPEKFVFEMKPVSQDRVSMIEKEWTEVNGGKTVDEVVALNEKTVDIDM
jgi:Cytochrome P450